MQKGFTLIELLVVIAILAVLATAVVLVLNPAELIRQGRDSTRISDMGALNSAIALFLADVTNPVWAATTRCTSGIETVVGAACVTNALTNVTGTGWINLDFSLISSGSPLARLPLDPVNNSAATACAGVVDGCYYGYRSSATVGRYKLFTNMESGKYSAPAGASEVESASKDGGTVADWYELGSDMSL
ncbi:MAG: prepilin-type N-terminal cleavage/methylation domain-containing protein [Patescibacteria group bacterium]